MFEKMVVHRKFIDNKNYEHDSKWAVTVRSCLFVMFFFFYGFSQLYTTSRLDTLMTNI